ncbi:MAG: calcium/sodium antiporter [Gammaproteobacteria bacterium]|uniref:Calcium/sodium antiporter n=1 Tax=Candidatus Thiopontia autotrophica TaxID=2841688 RepID=A0A8J6TVN0_9GAMM|nr:calcium/sodium antiporter [Candidatus Thiopontia autotrophica]MBL6969327.1 calcium/sodium antiporter [Gammaproteobacteria bacterium]
MIENLIAIVAGIAILVWSADRFVMGAAATAQHMNISPLIIGLVIMGFGTSAPEMMVSSLAAMEGSPSIGIGNAIGSNIANIALVLGATAMILPITVRSEILRREFPILIAVTIGCGLILLDYSLDRMDGAILLFSLILLMAWLIQTSKESSSSDTLGTEVGEEIPQLPIKRALFWTVAGLIALLLSSRLIVWAAVEIAQAFGISELIIGLTIIAIGTSLPELAASITAALKREHDMAIGNIIGSNMFNILGVLALPGLIAPSIIEPSVLSRDFMVMAALTLMLFIMVRLFGSNGQVADIQQSTLKTIGRIEGTILLACFFSYLGLLYYQTL